MKKQIQPTSPKVAAQRARWGKSLAVSILAIGLFYTWGARLNAQVVDPPVGNVSPAEILNNKMQTLYGINLSQATTSVEIENALIAALDEFPGPNPVDAADNPGYSNYTPEDLVTYILDSATNSPLTSAISYKSLASAVVKTAITTLQSINATWPTTYTNSVVEKIVGGASAVIENRLPGDYVPPAGVTNPATIESLKETAVATAIDGVITTGIAADPGDANEILQEAVNEIVTPPSNPSVSTLVSGSLTLTESVDAVMATIKAVPATSALTTASGAMTTLGDAFFASPTTTGTFLSANQNFVLASLKAAPTTIPNLPLVITESGEALMTGGPITTATGAASYSTPFFGAPVSTYAGIAQGIASYITGIQGQTTYAELLTTGTGVIPATLGTKATAANDGTILGGVIANNPSQITTYLADGGSAIYTAINTSHTLGTDANRVSFVDGALVSVASSTTAVHDLIEDTILTGTNFVDNSHFATTDFISLIDGATAAVKAVPGTETTLVNDLYAANLFPNTSGTAITLTVFGFNVTKGASGAVFSGTAGATAFDAFIADDTAVTTDSERETVANAVAGVATGNSDLIREETAIGLVSALTSPSDIEAGFTGVYNTTADTVDTTKATFVGNVANALIGNTTAVNDILDGAFATSGNGKFASAATGAGDIAKIIPTDATNVANEAVTNQPSPTSTSAAGFLTDESILSSIVMAIDLKYPAEITPVANTVAAQILTGDTNSADLAIFTQVALGTALLTHTEAVAAGIADAAATFGENDTYLIAYSKDTATDLDKDEDQVAGGVAEFLTNGTDAAALAADTASFSGSTTATATIRSKVAAAVAFYQPSYAAQIVEAVVGGDGYITADSSATDQATIAGAVAAQAPGSAGAIVTALEPNYTGQSLALTDFGALGGAVTKNISLTLPLGTRQSDIGAIATALLSGTATSGSSVLNSGSSNVIAVLVKGVATAAAAGGDLLSQGIIDGANGHFGLVTGVDNVALEKFVASADLVPAAALGAIQISEGAAETISDLVSFANSVAIDTGTTVTSETVKAYLAEGVAIAAPSSEAASISSTVAGVITDGFSLSGSATPTAPQALVETKDNGYRDVIAEDVAKAQPLQALDIAYAVAQQIDVVVTGTSNSNQDTQYATLAKDVATAVNLVLPKANLAEQIGAIASEVITAASESKYAPYLSEYDYADIIEQVSNVKAGTAYDIVGAGIATLAVDGVYTGAALTAFESYLESVFPTATAAQALELTEAEAAITAYNNDADSFDVGPVTRPETGVTNA